MKIYIVGIGMGSTHTLTLAAQTAIVEADLLLGAARMVQSAQQLRLEAGCQPAKQSEAIAPKAIATAIADAGDVALCVVLCSGDTGFFSLASSVRDVLGEEFPQAAVETLPGITTVQYLAAKLGRPWQQVRLGSAHGRDCNVLGLVLSNPEVFLLTGGEQTPATIIEMLCKCGLGSCQIVVGERLSYEDERITHSNAEGLLGKPFDALSAIWISHGPLVDEAVQDYVGVGGIPDEAFIRGEVPMTKRDVRALCTARLHPARGEVVWDVGAGTGSVSIEAACMQPFARVFAVETKPQGCRLIEENRSKFGAYNVQVVEGRAPEALEGLPAPDAAFIGGSTGGLEQIVRYILTANSGARLVITAVTLETIAQTSRLLNALQHEGLLGEYQAMQIAAASTRKAGNYHLMQAENPIMIFEAAGREPKEAE